MARRKSLFLLSVSAFIMMLGVGMIVAILPKKVIELSDSSSPVGYLASFFAISYLLMQAPLGRLADRFGYRPFLAAGYLVCSITGLIYYFSGSAFLLFLGRLLQGAGEAPIWSLAPAVLSIHYSGNKARVMGIYNASLHLGLTAGPLLGFAILRFWPDNGPFVFFSLGCAFSALLVWRIEPDRPARKTPPEKRLSDKTEIWSFLEEGWMVLAGVVLYGAGYGLSITNIPAFLICEKGFSQGSVFIFFILFYLGICLSQLVAGPWSDRFGAGRLLIVGMLAAAINLALFPGCEQNRVMVPLFLASFSLGVFYVSSMSYLNERVSDTLKGTVSGAYYLAWGLGYFAGPLVFRTGGSFLILAGLMLVQSLALLSGRILKE